MQGHWKNSFSPIIFHFKMWTLPSGNRPHKNINYLCQKPCLTTHSFISTVFLLYILWARRILYHVCLSDAITLVCCQRRKEFCACTYLLENLVHVPLEKLSRVSEIYFSGRPTICCQIRATFINKASENGEFFNTGPLVIAACWAFYTQTVPFLFQAECHIAVVVV